MYTKDEEDIALKSSSETHVSVYNFIDTDVITDLATERAALEYAFVYKSFSFQTEFLQMRVKPERRDNDTINESYVFLSYFVTGDSSNYNKSSAAFGEVKPNKELNPGKGNMGALETGVRFSCLDMEGTLNGGKLNWYPGGGLKFMLNHTKLGPQLHNLEGKSVFNP